MTKIIHNTQNPLYVEALQNLWNSAEDMMTYSSEPLKELYRICSIVSFFARQANKLESIREELGLAQENKDVSTLRRLQRKSQHLQEEKAFENIWNHVAERYDNLLQMFLQENSNNDLLLQIPTAEDIFERNKKISVAPSKKELDSLVEIIKAEIDL